MNLKNPMFSFPSDAAKGHGGLSWTLARKSLLDYEEKNVDYIDAYLANFALRQRPSTIYTLDSKHFPRPRGDVRQPTA